MPSENASLLFQKIYFKIWQRIKRITNSNFVISFQLFKEIFIVFIVNFTFCFFVFSETYTVVSFFCFKNFFMIIVTPKLTNLLIFFNFCYMKTFAVNFGNNYLNIYSLKPYNCIPYLELLYLDSCLRCLDRYLKPFLQKI